MLEVKIRKQDIQMFLTCTKPIRKEAKVEMI